MYIYIYYWWICFIPCFSNCVPYELRPKKQFLSAVSVRYCLHENYVEIIKASLIILMCFTDTRLMCWSHYLPNFFEYRLFLLSNIYCHPTLTWRKHFKLQCLKYFNILRTFICIYFFSMFLHVPLFSNLLFKDAELREKNAIFNILLHKN